MKTTYQVAVLFSVFILIIFSNAHAADPKAELLKTLTNLKPATDFSATVKITKTRTEIENDNEETTKSDVKIGLHADSAGFHISLPQTLLEHVQREAPSAAADEEITEKVSQLVSSLDLLKLKELMNFSPEIQDMLNDARLTKQSDELFANKPAHKLNFDVSLEINEEIRDDIDEVEATLTIWLDAKSGIPVALANSYHVAGSKFFIDFSSYEKNTYLLDLIDGRLVVTSLRRESGGAGFGPQQKTVTEIKLTPM